MLVLSRTEGDGISFPELDLAIQVLKVHGNRVQIGVKAAEEIRVLRTELLGRAEKQKEPDNAQAQHALRNRLNSVSLAMSIAQKHLERGDVKKAELALTQIAEKLRCQPAINPPAQERSGLPRSTCNVKVLLVEDNSNESSLLAQLLQLHGLDVDVASDGDEAIRSMKTRMPDVVLLDMNMAGLDGPSTLQSIRCNPLFQDVKIYAVTGSDQKILGIQIDSREGVNQWFQKPVESQRLLQAIRGVPLGAEEKDELIQLAP